MGKSNKAKYKVQVSDGVNEPFSLVWDFKDDISSDDPNDDVAFWWACDDDEKHFFRLFRRGDDYDFDVSCKQQIRETCCAKHLDVLDIKCIENKASKRAIQYNANHTKRVYVSLNTEYDKDLIDALAKETNKLGLIKSLLRQHYFGGNK